MSASNPPVRNNEGFLEDAATWTDEVAWEIAQEDDIELTEKHWEIIYFLRDFYKQHEISPPSNRLFVKAVREALGDEKGDSNYGLPECCPVDQVFKRDTISEGEGN